jgi:thiamine biosynthesis lipoprotein
VRRLFHCAALLVLGCACRAASHKNGADAASVASPAVNGASTSTSAQTIARSYFAMGTQISFSAYTRDEDRALLAFEAAFREMSRLEDLLTVWKETSDISNINRRAGEREAVHVSPETIDILTRAQALSELTRGKFDVTFGALSGLWKFDHDQDDQIPSRAEIEKRLQLIDYRKIKIDPRAETVALVRAGMRIHLGGIGKGYAVDRAVAILRARGLTDFMVQAGGDLFVAGTHGDRPWRVGIRDPRGPPSSYFAAAEVTDATFSTSGDYERSFTKEGRRYHHIIDPGTGEPATRSRSVTIMAPDATTAEGLSKGVFILGWEEGFKIIERVPGSGAVVVDSANQIHISERLKGRIKILFAPTDAL